MTIKTDDYGNPYYDTEVQLMTSQSNGTSGLHKDPAIFDRQETTLAYEAEYYPQKELSGAHKVVWSNVRHWTKAELLKNLNETKTHLFYPPILGERVNSEGFLIRWEYNNIPTATEWENLFYTHMFRIEFRISPVISGSGRVALIRHKYHYPFLPSSRTQNKSGDLGSFGESKW